MTEEVTDEEIEKLEEELKQLEDKDTAPKSAQKDSLFRFFREILTTKDTSRIGDLTAQELGLTKLGIRHYQEIAAYANVEGLDKVSDYLTKKSQIISATSMSKNGFWPQLFVTQIRQEKKEKPKEEKKKGWFAKRQEKEVE